MYQEVAKTGVVLYLFSVTNESQVRTFNSFSWNENSLIVSPALISIPHISVSLLFTVITFRLSASDFCFYEMLTVMLEWV